MKASIPESPYKPYPKLVIGNTYGWERLAELGDVVEIESYELLINPQDDEAGYCYVVLSGSMAAKKFRRGHEAVTFNIRQRGALLFERHALIDTNQKEVYFEALEPTVLKRITRKQLQDAVTKDPELCFTMIDSLFDKLASSVDQFEDSHTRTVPARLLSLLQELAVAATTPQEDATWLHIDLKLSQQTMADILCVNRVTVSKALNTLKESGDIRMQGRQILVNRESLID
ncbi:MAG: Crp/Fnr family transcriptional regulator [Eggerthellaceae bacterium]|nr:Crp/Fnr family transcriptional regulator [Eggerthellaceae bacterium]